MSSEKEKVGTAAPGTGLKIIPLGGLDEVGKNLTVLEYGDEIILIDCGSSFPQEDLLGIDLVIPDVTYLEKNAHKVKAFLITHGHEDHIGALPYVFRKFQAPIYGTRLTLALIENKFKEHHIQNADMHCIAAGNKVEIGRFGVEFIKVSHSIAGAVALAIRTPVGTVIHTGDFKVDFTPVDGEIIDLGRFASLGRSGVVALLADSTNSEKRGSTISERKVGDAFFSLFREATGRIIIASFASNVHRVQQIIDVAAKYKRKVCLSGRSMVNVANLAIELGDLLIPDNMMVPAENIHRYPDDEVVIITTGSQGEAMSALVRMAMDEHRQLSIKVGDTVIISASAIPGNEKFVNRVINQLYRKGAKVIYESIAEVHTSGHACQEELKLLHSLVRPKYFIPVHGEYRHMMRHAMLAEEIGTPKKNIFICEIGDVIEINEKRKAKVASSVPAGRVLVDGLGIGDVGSVVLRDRRALSQDGLLVVIVAVDKANGSLISGPDIISRGFVYVRESEDLMEKAKLIVCAQVEQAMADFRSGEWNNVKNGMRNALREYLYQKTKRHPMILPVVIEV